MVNTGISNKIKAIREAKGLNHREFAEPLHVSASYISQIEAGKKMPGDSLLDLIMLKYNVSTEWWEVGTCPIFREETKKNPPGNMNGEVTRLTILNGVIVAVSASDNICLNQTDLTL